MKERPFGSSPPRTESILPPVTSVDGAATFTIRRLVFAFMILCTSAASLRGQGYDDRRANVITAGFGGLNGGLGVSYRRLLGVAPISVGIGYGGWGPALGIDLTVVGGRGPLGGAEEPEARLALGAALIVTDRLDDQLGGALLILEFATQTWPGLDDRLFGEAGFGFILTPFGEWPSLVFPLMLRIQVGFGF